MSSESSLVTTAASDSSSSADSRYFSGGARRGSGSATSRPAEWSSRRRSYNWKARGVVLAPGAPRSQKVLCVCKVCRGQRLVSKSTCYRHLRIEAEDEVARGARWRPAYMNASHLQALRMYSIMHLARIQLGF